MRLHLKSSPSSGMQSVVYAIDDVLLPQVVTIPLTVALSTFSSGNDKLSRRVQNASGALSKVSSDVQSMPLAPMAAAGMALAPPASDSSDNTDDSSASSAAASPSSGNSGSSGGSGGSLDDGGVSAGASGGASSGDSSTDGSRRLLSFN